MPRRDRNQAVVMEEGVPEGKHGGGIWCHFRGGGGRPGTTRSPLMASPQSNLLTTTQLRGYTTIIWGRKNLRQEERKKKKGAPQQQQ